MKKISLLFSVCCVMVACNQSPKSRAFDAFKKKIPMLKLPYKKACSDTVGYLKLNIPDSILKKYAPPGTTGIIGMIKDTDFYTAIVYSVKGDIDYPVVQTYNAEGDSLNNIGIMEGTCCGNSANCSGTFWGEISKDLTISLHDSEKVFEMDKAGNYSTIKFKNINNTQVYNITNDGYLRLKNAGSGAVK